MNRVMSVSTQLYALTRSVGFSVRTQVEFNLALVVAEGRVRELNTPMASAVPASMRSTQHSGKQRHKAQPRAQRHTPQPTWSG